MDHDVLQFGTLQFEVPADCPQPDIFKAAVHSELLYAFGTPHTAERSRQAWLESQAVPEPFASNREAAAYYRLAAMQLKPQALTWETFVGSVMQAFRDHAEDGGHQQQPIPGWELPYSYEITADGKAQS